MKIRNMLSGDLPQVKDLAKQLGYDVGPDDLQESFDSISIDQDYALFVACNEEKIIGFIQINIEAKTLLLGPRADISALVVDESARSLGVGKELVKAAESWVKEKNLKIVRVRSGVKRERAHKFYEREGYAFMKTGHTFQKDLTALK